MANDMRFEAWFHASSQFTPMQRLRSACQYWVEDRLSKQQFVAAIHECFRDDNQYDWYENSCVELQRFANSIIDGE